MNPIKEPVHIPSADGRFRFEDYTYEWCPRCNSDVVIYSSGITACPTCGEPLAPCSQCNTCDYDTCPYGCAGCGSHIRKEVTNPAISEEEIGWFNILNIISSPGKEA